MDKPDTSRLYTPRQIADAGWILSYEATKSYFYVLSLIKSGALKAQRVKNGWYRVTGAEIIRYKREVEGTEI